MNKKNILICIGVLIVCLSIIGVSYSFFTTNITNSNIKDNIVRAGKMKLIFKDNTPEITTAYMKPGDIIIKEFSVENTSNKTIKYNLNITDIENNLSDKSDLEYRLEEIKGDEEEEIDKGEVPSEEKYILIGKEIEVGEEKKQRYRLYIEFKLTEEDQNDNQGKVFRGRIGIDDKEDVKNRDIILAVMVDGKERKTFPTKDEGYIYNGIECENGGSGTFDYVNWKLKLETNGPDKCSVLFRSKESYNNLVEACGSGNKLNECLEITDKNEAWQLFNNIENQLKVNPMPMMQNFSFNVLPKYFLLLIAKYKENMKDILNQADTYILALVVKYLCEKENYALYDVTYFLTSKEELIKLCESLIRIYLINYHNSKEESRTRTIDSH